MNQTERLGLAWLLGLTLYDNGWEAFYVVISTSHCYFHSVHTLSWSFDTEHICGCLVRLLLLKFEDVNVLDMLVYNLSWAERFWSRSLLWNRSTIS